MGKKHLKFLTVFVSIFFLVGCDNTSYLPKSFAFESKFPNSYMENNAVKYHKDKFAGFTKSEKMTKYDGVTNHSTALSYAVVFNRSNSTYRYGIYDLVNKTEILPPIYGFVVLGETYYYNAHTSDYQTIALAHVTSSDGLSQSVYCLQEKTFILPFANYDDMDFNYELGVKHNTEVFSLLIDSKITYKYFAVTFDTSGNLVRKDLIVDENYIKEPEKQGIPFLPKLKDYEYEISNTKLTGYKNGKEVFTVIYPFGALFTSFVMDKYCYIQTKTKVADDTKNFSYFHEGNKYVLDTSRIDLTNGKVKNYKNFDFVINFNYDGEVKLDKNKEGTLVILVVQKIEDNVLLESASVLFDVDLKGLVNLSAKNYSDTFYKVGTNRYLTGNREIVNENYEKVLDLSNYAGIRYLPSVGLISLWDGYYGLIDPSGKIIMPFEYQGSFLFFNGYTYNKNMISNEFVQINASGQWVTTNEAIYGSYEREGIVYSESMGITTYKNYDGYTLFSLTNAEEIYNVREFYYAISEEKAGCVYEILNVDDNTYEYYILT